MNFPCLVFPYHLVPGNEITFAEDSETVFTGNNADLAFAPNDRADTTNKTHKRRHTGVFGLVVSAFSRSKLDGDSYGNTETRMATVF